MDGVHDLGGMDGFGPIEPDEVDQTFRHEWEAAVFAMAYGAGDDVYNTDEGRHAIEQMPPAAYLEASYYERWLFMLERMLTAACLVDEDELRRALARFGTADTFSKGLPEREDSALVDQWLDMDRAAVTTRYPPVEPAFEVGDAVTVRNIHPEGHTRCPQYVRKADGRVGRVHGTFVFPDANAERDGEQPEPLYNVEFEGAELWGDDAEENVSLRIDLFESYLTPSDE